LIANISGTDEAIDKRKTALETMILFTFDERWSTNEKPVTYDLGFVRLFLQTIIKLSAAVYESSCTQTFCLIPQWQKKSENPVL